VRIARRIYNIKQRKRKNSREIYSENLLTHFLLFFNNWGTITLMALVKNKKAYFNFTILDSYEAGVELFGFEVKSLKEGQGSLEGAYVIIRGGEAFLVSAYIPPYQLANTPKNYDPYRIRRLLLHKKEIGMLVGNEKQKGLTIVPLSLYNKGGKIKAEIAVVRGKKSHDKRETIKKRESQRDINRTLKTGRE